MNNELNEKLAMLQYLMRKKRMRGRPMADTMPGQGRILALLKMRDGVSVQDLSYLLGLAVSSVSELLGKLEKGGYVTREQSGQDKRVTIVKLTEKGRNEQMQNDADLYDAFSCLSEKEQKTLGEFLDRIIDGLKKNFGFDENDERFKEFWQSFASGERGRRGFWNRGPYGFRGFFKGNGETYNADLNADFKGDGGSFSANFGKGSNENKKDEE